MASIVARYNAPLICFDKARAVQAMAKHLGCHWDYWWQYCLIVLFPRFVCRPWWYVAHSIVDGSVCVHTWILQGLQNILNRSEVRDVWEPSESKWDRSLELIPACIIVSSLTQSHILQRYVIVCCPRGAHFKNMWSIYTNTDNLLVISSSHAFRWQVGTLAKHSREAARQCCMIFCHH